MDAYRAVVDKRDQRAFLPRPLPDDALRRIQQAAVIVVLVQTERHEFDAGRGAQNMMVAAWNDGIGSCPAHLPETGVARRRRPLDELVHEETW